MCLKFNVTGETEFQENFFGSSLLVPQAGRTFLLNLFGAVNRACERLLRKKHSCRRAIHSGECDCIGDDDY